MPLRVGSGLLFAWRRRLTPAGELALAGLVGSAVWGVDTNASMAFQAFSFLAALLLLANCSGWFFRPKVSLTRSLPRFGTAGQAIRYRIRVANLSSRPLRATCLREELADPRPDFERFHAAKNPKDDRYHWLERVLGYARWRRLVKVKSAKASCGEVPDLPPGASGEVEAELVAPRRGRLELKAVSIGAADPLGLSLSWARRRAESAVLILPKRYPVPRLELPGTRRYQQGGVTLAAKTGDSQEFMSLREYRPGDPLRRIHWRSWAKTGKPVVRENQEEFFVRHALALDTFSAEADDAFEEAVSVAASFACSVVTQESLLDLLFVGASTYCVTAGRGLGGAEQLLEALAGATPRPEKPFADLEAAVLRRRSGLSGCIAVLLAWDEPRRAFVRRLRASGVPVLPLVILPAGTSAPAEPPDAPVRFLEAGRISEGLAVLS